MLRDQRGENNETLETYAETAQQLFDHLRNQYHFTLKTQSLRVAINDEFVDWNTLIHTGDTVVFIPPVSGG